MELTKREFLKLSGQAALALGLADSVFSGAEALGRKSIEETLKPENYSKLTKKWDPIYGPPLLWFSRYGGKCDFEGHKRDSYGITGPGIDYDVPMATPLVPAGAFFSHYLTKRTTGGLVTWMYFLSDRNYKFNFSHLEDVLLSDAFRHKINLGEPFRVVTRAEIVALSGNSGQGPREYGGVQPQHLHFSLVKSRIGSEEWIDPDKFGLDGGKPIFWDGETNLDLKPEKRLLQLEKTIKNLGNELKTWQGKEVEELNGNLVNYYNEVKDYEGTQILDSKHFQDLRALLKKVTLEGKDYIPETKYIPGTKPYSLAQKILAYSMAPPHYNQPIIVNLPFISPQLVSKYKVKKPVYEEGPFYQIIDGKMRQIK
jgi:hypothetical protein